MGPKLLNDNQKQQQRVEVCSEFVTALHCYSRAMLDSIMTMDEMMVCYHIHTSDVKAVPAVY
jgi:hypothetical protein